MAGTEPSLVTVMSNPIAVPADTGPGGLADFATSTWAPTTVADSFASEQWPAAASLSAFPGYDAIQVYLPAAVGW